MTIQERKIQIETEFNEKVNSIQQYQKAIQQLSIELEQLKGAYKVLDEIDKENTAEAVSERG